MSGSFPADLEEMRQAYVRARDERIRANEYEKLAQMETLKDQIDVSKCLRAYTDMYIQTGVFYSAPLECRSKERAYSSEPSAWVRTTFSERHPHYKVHSYEDRGDTGGERVYVSLDHTKFKEY